MIMFLILTVNWFPTPQIRLYNVLFTQLSGSFEVALYSSWFMYFRWYFCYYYNSFLSYSIAPVTIISFIQPLPAALVLSCRAEPWHLAEKEGLDLNKSYWSEAWMHLSRRKFGVQGLGWCQCASAYWCVLFKSICWIFPPTALCFAFWRSLKVSEIDSSWVKHRQKCSRNHLIFFRHRWLFCSWGKVQNE